MVLLLYGEDFVFVGEAFRPVVDAKRSSCCDEDECFLVRGVAPLILDFELETVAVVVEAEGPVAAAAANEANNDMDCGILYLKEIKISNILQ